MSNLTIVGKIGNNTVTLPENRQVRFAGGSGYFASLSASYFTRPSLVSRTGNDLPPKSLEALSERGVDLTHVEVLDQKANVWRARYPDLTQHETEGFDINIDERIGSIPPALVGTPFLCVTEMDPELQLDLISQSQARSVLLDTKICWVMRQPEALKKAIARTRIAMMNEQEAEKLFGGKAPYENLMKIRELGPEIGIVNLSRNGSLIIIGDYIFHIPGLSHQPVETTGGGDTFAGAFIGALAAGKKPEEAFIYGQVMSSFVVEDHGPARLFSLTTEEISGRFDEAEKLILAGAE